MAHTSIPRFTKKQLLDLFRGVMTQVEWETATAANCVDGKPVRGAVTVKKFMGYIFQARWMRCGPRCAKCPHGPYLYVRRRIGKRQFQQVLGNPFTKPQPRS
jgi:hypothetical protein